MTQGLRAGAGDQRRRLPGRAEGQDARCFSWASRTRVSLELPAGDQRRRSRSRHDHQRLRASTRKQVGPGRRRDPRLQPAGALQGQGHQVRRASAIQTQGRQDRQRK
ncbi:MAG: hypothetical protein MZV70_34385 [Desulfobacterales bacterium]|nr:hypothetical protein [Desulfobacterales bacterium]